MSRLRIVTDSTCDYSVEEANNLGIDMIPLRLFFEDVEYLDGITITKNEFYNKLINEHLYPKTSQGSMKDFLKIFNDAKEKGDEVIVLVIAQALSGTINSANLAKEESGYDKIHIIDTKTTIGGLRLLINEALKLDKEGLPAIDICEKLENLIPRIQILAAMNTLEYLRKGGRLSGFGAVVGELINLKPIIVFDAVGRVEVIQKPIGKIRANRAMIQFIQNKQIDENYPVYYYYSHVEENLIKFEDSLKQHNLYLPGQRVNLSPVVGCHIGDNAYGIVYIKKA